MDFPSPSTHMLPGMHVSHCGPPGRVTALLSWNQRHGDPGLRSPTSLWQSPGWTPWPGGRPESLAASPSLPGRPSQTGDQPSSKVLEKPQPQSTERHGSGAGHHGNPWLPSPAHRLPCRLCVLTPKTAYSAPGISRLDLLPPRSKCGSSQTAPSPRGLPSPHSFPGKALETFNSAGPPWRPDITWLLPPAAQMAPIFILATVWAGSSATSRSLCQAPPSVCRPRG